MNQSKFDLDERLLEFAVRIVRVTESMKRSRAGNHVSDQLLRAGTSPYGNHGEAEGAESRADFVHKLRICYKELRETRRWLKLVHRVPLVAKPALLEPLVIEADELVRIFSASIRTAVTNGKAPGNAQRSTFNAQRSSEPSDTVTAFTARKGPL